MRLGVVKGDRVGIMLPNCPQYIIAAFATLRLGAIVVNINPIYTAREVLTVANDAGFKVILTLDTAGAAGARRPRATPRSSTVIVTSLAEYSAEAAAPPRVDETLALADLIATKTARQICRA